MLKQFSVVKHEMKHKLCLVRYYQHSFGSSQSETPWFFSITKQLFLLWFAFSERPSGKIKSFQELHQDLSICFSVLLLQHSAFSSGLYWSSIHLKIQDRSVLKDWVLMLQRPQFSLFWKYNECGVEKKHQKTTGSIFSLWCLQQLQQFHPPQQLPLAPSPRIHELLSLSVCIYI